MPVVGSSGLSVVSNLAVTGKPDQLVAHDRDDVRDLAALVLEAALDGGAVVEAVAERVGEPAVSDREAAEAAAARPVALGHPVKQVVDPGAAQRRL
jgi:hypothetical protein